jgi:hypothetical protein
MKEEASPRFTKMGEINAFFATLAKIKGDFVKEKTEKFSSYCEQFYYTCLTTGHFSMADVRKEIEALELSLKPVMGKKMKKHEKEIECSTVDWFKKGFLNHWQESATKITPQHSKAIPGYAFLEYNFGVREREQMLALYGGNIRNELRDLLKPCANVVVKKDGTMERMYDFADGIEEWESPKQGDVDDEEVTGYNDYLADIAMFTKIADQLQATPAFRVNRKHASQGVHALLLPIMEDLRTVRAEVSLSCRSDG